MNIVKSIGNKVKGFIIWFQQASLKKKAAVIVAAIIVLFIITRPLRAKPVQYQTATVTRGTIQEAVSESGNIASSGQTDVPSVSTGVIEELDVNNGDTVSAGQTLFKVKSTVTDQDKATAYANYLAAQTALNSAQAKSNSLQAALFTANQAFVNDAGTANPDTADPKYIEERANWLQAEADYKNQAAVVSQAQAALNSAGLAYQATQDVTVTAPVDGTVENLAYGVGDKVTAAPSATSPTTAASSVIGSSSPVLYIVTDGASQSSEAVVQINEVDYPKVKMGQSASITLPAFPNQTFRGHVTRIDQIGTNTSSVISFNVYLKIDNPDRSIAPNMTVNVDISTAKHTNTLMVPNSAIKPYKGGKAVEVLDKSKPAKNQIKFVPVTIGIKGIDQTEILSGVTEGTVVVTGTGTAAKPAGGTVGG